MVLCQAPIDFIAFVQVKEKDINFEPILGTSQKYVDLPELFGGLKREGGIKGWISYLFGGHLGNEESSQAAHPYLSNILGANYTSAHRDVISVILNRICIGTSYYMHPWRFFATRVTVRRKGIPQWQPLYACPRLPLNFTYSYTYVGASETPELFGLVTTTGAPTEVHTGYYVIKGTKVWLVVDDTRLTETGGFALVAEGNIYASGGLINAVHVIRECLTDIDWGMGEAEADIDELSFTSAAITCYTEGLGFSWLWDKSKPIGDFIAEVAGHINAVVYRDRKTNLWKITLIRKISNIASLPVITTDHVTKIGKLSRKQFHELTSQFLLKYESNLTYKEASIRVSDPSLASRQGKEVLSSATFSGVATPEVGQVIAERELKALSTPVFTGSITGDRTLAELNPGDAFILKAFGGMETDLVLRVVSLDLGTILKEPVTIDFTEDAFEATKGITSFTEGTKWTAPSSAASPVLYRKIFESLYFVQALEKGDTAAQAISTSTTFLRATAVSPTGLSTHAELWDTAAAVYSYKGLIDFQFSALLNGAIDKTTTEIPIDNYTDEELLSANTFLYLEEELIYVSSFTRVSPDPHTTTITLTVLRGVLDTVPEAHADNTRLIALGSTNSSDSTEYSITETVTAKLLTVTSEKTLAIADAPVDTLDFVGRMHLPYPPGNLKINGTNWNTAVGNSGNLVFTWTSRNRFQQTTAVITDYYAASVTSEPSVTYNLRLLLDSDDTSLYSYSGAVLTKTVDYTDLPPSLTYPAMVRVELESENANGTSFQVVKHIFELPATDSAFYAEDGVTQFTDADGVTIFEA
jgi:hypothetical protein